MAELQLGLDPSGNPKEMVTDTNGYQKVSLATLISGEDTAQNLIRVSQVGYVPYSVAGTATEVSTAISGAAISGTLAGYSVTAVGKADSTASLWDGNPATGTQICAINTLAITDGVKWVYANCSTSMYIKCRDDNTTLRVTLLYME
jgi:hypothetical protein